MRFCGINKKRIIKRFFKSVITFLMFVAGVTRYHNLPDKVPSLYNFVRTSTNSKELC